MMTSSLNCQNLEYFVFFVCYDWKILYVRLIWNWDLLKYVWNKIDSNQLKLQKKKNYFSKEWKVATNSAVITTIL